MPLGEEGVGLGFTPEFALLVPPKASPEAFSCSNTSGKIVLPNLRTYCGLTMSLYLIANNCTFKNICTQEFARLPDSLEIKN